MKPTISLSDRSEAAPVGGASTLGGGASVSCIGPLNVPGFIAGVVQVSTAATTVISLAGIVQGLVDGGALELEVLKVLGKRQFGDGELVLDRVGLLLVDLGG
jgi:hypothetical protein